MDCFGKIDGRFRLRQCLTKRRDSRREARSVRTGHAVRECVDVARLVHALDQQQMDMVALI